MKIITKFFLLTAVVLSFSLSAQKRISTLPVQEKFQINKKLYTGKKVKDLLKDIKSEISSASFYGGWKEEASRITLRFEGRNDKIVIFVKENDSETNKLFLSKDSKQNRIIRDQAKYRTNNDILKKYENLTISDVLVF